MTAFYVTVLLDRVTADGAQVTRGAELVAPSLEFPDPIGLVEPGVIERHYSPAGVPSVKLVANDTAGPQQDNGDPGWSYVFTPVDVDGAQALTLWVLSTGGATQNLSDLATAPVAQPGAQYLAKPSQPGTAGQVLTIGEDGTPEWDDEAAGAVASVNGQTGAVDLDAGDVSALPVAETFSLANNAYKVKYEWTVTGQTLDPLPSFGLVAGSQTYSWHTGGETTQGPAYWWGINPRHLSGWVPNSPHAALGISAFQTAGDTYNPATGGRGMEFNVAWVSPSGAKGVAPIEIVAADDETRTVTLALRMGDGQFTTLDGSQYVSGFTLSDAAGNAYMSAGPFNNSAYGAVAAGTQPGVTLNQPLALTSLPYLFGSSAGKMQVLFNAAGAAGNGSVSWSVSSNSDTVTATWQGGTGVTHTVYTVAGPAIGGVQSSSGLATSSVTAAGSNNAAKFQATSAAGTAQFILNGNSSTSAQMVWQKAGVNTWVMQDSGGSSLYLTNNSGQAHMLLISGNNASPNWSNAKTHILTDVLAYGVLSDGSGNAYAKLASPAFTGSPTAPTATAGDSSTKLATTAFTAGAVSALAGTLGTAAFQPSTAFDAAGAASAAQAAAIAASDPAGSAAAAQSAAESYGNATFVPWSLLGQPNGVASLDSGGLLPSAQLPAGIAPSLAVVATTGLTGYTLVNGTGTILSWTAPNDGQLHRVLIHAGLHVTSAETGGVISASITHPDGSVYPGSLYPGGAGTNAVSGATIAHPVKPGSTVTISQTSALTAGAAVMWAEILAL